MEISLGDWLVVSYQNMENFVVNFIKVKNGRMIGKFLRPAGTRDSAGFVYKYPIVEDEAAFQFFQVKKVLNPPLKFGRRGLLKFEISHDDLRVL